MQNTLTDDTDNNNYFTFYTVYNYKDKVFTYLLYLY